MSDREPLFPLDGLSHVHDDDGEPTTIEDSGRTQLLTSPNIAPSLGLGPARHGFDPLLGAEVERWDWGRLAELRQARTTESHMDAGLWRPSRAPPWTHATERHLEYQEQQNARSLPAPSFLSGSIPAVRLEREPSVPARDEEEYNLPPTPSFHNYFRSPTISQAHRSHIDNSPSTYSPPTSTIGPASRFGGHHHLYIPETTTTEPAPRSSSHGRYALSVPENDDDASDRVRGPGNPPADPQRIFACPFYLRDPSKHRRCVKFALKRIKDVKQHLNRKHKRPDHYCPVCHKTFPSSSLRDSHIRVRSCHLRAPPLQTLSDGISADQLMELQRRVDRNHTAEQQYMQIWETVFPGEKAPASVYLGTRASETVLIMRRVWDRDGQGIIESVVTGPLCGDAVSTMGKFRAGVARVIDRFLDRVQQEDGIAADNDTAAVPPPTSRPRSHGPAPGEHDETRSLPPHPRSSNSGGLDFDDWLDDYGWQLDQPPALTD